MKKNKLKIILNGKDYSIYGSILLVTISLFLYFDYILQKDKIMVKIYLQGNVIEFQTENSNVNSVEEFLKKIN